MNQSTAMTGFVRVHRGVPVFVVAGGTIVVCCEADLDAPSITLMPRRATRKRHRAVVCLDPDDRVRIRRHVGLHIAAPA